MTTAVASYLHARQAAGQWLVRIEDIDPPREVAGASDRILRTLEAFDLYWDGPVLYQSRRGDEYAAAAQRLLGEDLAFRCSCSRSTLREVGAEQGPYPGTCRTRGVHGEATSIRVRVDAAPVQFVDGLQGDLVADLTATTGDYVIWRRDGLPAYHLAVVLDDAAQGVTTVVRGSDLLEPTAVHVHLQRTLGLPTPRYFHTPIVLNAEGQKLSKQTGAIPVESRFKTRLARQALGLLGADVPKELAGASPRELWRWAIENWQIDKLRGRREWQAAASAQAGPEGPERADPNG